MPSSRFNIPFVILQIFLFLYSNFIPFKSIRFPSSSSSSTYFLFPLIEIINFYLPSLIHLLLLFLFSSQVSEYFLFPCNFHITRASTKKSIEKIYYFLLFISIKRCEKDGGTCWTQNFFIFILYIFLLSFSFFLCVLTLWLKRTEGKVKFYAEVKRYEQIAWRFQARKSPQVSSSFVKKIQNFFVCFCKYVLIFKNTNWITNGLEVMTRLMNCNDLFGYQLFEFSILFCNFFQIICWIQQDVFLESSGQELAGGT